MVMIPYAAMVRNRITQSESGESFSVVMRTPPLRRTHFRPIQTIKNILSYPYFLVCLGAELDDSLGSVKWSLGSLLVHIFVLARCSSEFGALCYWIINPRSLREEEVANVHLT